LQIVLVVLGKALFANSPNTTCTRRSSACCLLILQFVTAFVHGISLGPASSSSFIFYTHLIKGVFFKSAGAWGVGIYAAMKKWGGDGDNVAADGLLPPVALDRPTVPAVQAVK
jgi:hypothetical protein